MTVAIVTSFGATKNYPDQSMMRRTFHAFLNSLRRQTDQDFRLFISCHDIPKDVPCDDPWIEWRSISFNDEHQGAMVPVQLPNTARDIINWKAVQCDGKNTDMGRKTYNSVIHAGLWAYENRLPGFWMLRMDSDDLLAFNMVFALNQLNTQKCRAVYNRNCHMYDPTRHEIAIHNYPSSTTCNALYYTVDRNGVFDPGWFYHCNDHTRFANMVRMDNIPNAEWDWTLCITTNSGNHISNRPAIDKEQHVRKIPMTRELAERYGIDGFKHVS